MTEQLETYCGFIAIVGRPNVGKSTLLNKILGQKISITSRKAQTTRHRIVGIKTEGPYQEIYVDTPGLHIEEKRAINRLMNRAASSAITDVDLVIFVVDGTHWNDDDEMVLNKLRKTKVPVVLAINKIDNIKNKDDLANALRNTISSWSEQGVTVSDLTRIHEILIKENKDGADRFLVYMYLLTIFFNWNGRDETKKYIKKVEDYFCVEEYINKLKENIS